MNGFKFVLNGIYKETMKLDCPELICGPEYFCEYKKMDKFQNDKLFFDNGKYMFLLDGVIFNKDEILECKDSRIKKWESKMLNLFEADRKGFMDKLRGSFCGVVYDYVKKELVAYTNHSGERALFYYQNSDLIIVTNHIELMYEALRDNGQKIEPAPQACDEMLLTGSLLHGNTMIKNVFRLTAGKRILLKNGLIEEERYHMFRNIPEHELSLEECIDKADELFRQAVDRIFRKNVEYGYKAEADLSGGLDSRLATWVANDLGYKNVINVCYCQKGKLDHSSSKKIAQYLNNEYLFYSLNGGDFLFDVDEVTEKTGGQIVYCLCTGANRAFKKLDMSNIGLAVTGLLGEIHNAYWTEGGEHTPANYTSVRYSETIKLEIPNYYTIDYDNYEQMNLYEFSNLVFLTSVFARQDCCEVYSPFIDKDYLEFAYKIPLKYRKDYYFTQNWILKKYPQAAKFVWQTKKKPIDYAYYNKFYIPKLIWDVEDFIYRCYNKACRVMKINSQLALKDEMNPFQLWYNTNAELRQFIQDYYSDNISLVKDESLKKKIDKMYLSNICRDKILAINILAIFKRYFNEDEKC